MKFPENIHDLRQRLSTLPVGSMEWHQCVAYNLSNFFHHEKVARRNSAMQLFRTMEGIWKHKPWLVLNETKDVKSFIEVYTGMPFPKVMNFLKEAGINAKILAEKFEQEADLMNERACVALAEQELEKAEKDPSSMKSVEELRKNLGLES